MREQLDRVRAEQYDEMHSLLDTRTPLNQLVGLRSDINITHFNETERKANRETVGSLEKAKVDLSRSRVIKRSDNITLDKDKPDDA